MASDLLSKLKSAANITEILASELRKRASELNDQKPHRGIALLQVCATESDVDVSEIESPASSERDPSPDFVGELLRAVKSEKVFGRRAEKEKLLSQLVPADKEIRAQQQLAVIPIVGMGGIGKTTLARLAYDDPTVREHFELRAWVKMDGQERNQTLDIARKLLRSATGMLSQLNNLSELDEMVSDALLSNRSLIVLDDVVSMETELWQRMRDSWFRFVGLGSKIVITTRDKQVAEVASSNAAFDLGELHQDDAWSLYSSLAFSRRENARLIAAAKLCKGLPLSLRLLGSLTRFEKALIQGISSSSSSPNLMELDTNSILSMSLLTLPQHLFNCFAYCGIFPYGYVLEKERLIKMWIADDVVKPSPSPLSSLEDIGEAYFNELLCRSFFTDLTCNEHDEIVEARMPSVIHKSAQEIAEVVFKDKIGNAFAVDAKSLHLSIASPFQQEIDYPKSLTTLLSFPHQKNLHLSGLDRSFVELKGLRSLDLSSSGIRKLSKHVSMLRKVRYLNLSNTHLTKLPNSITKLTRLQTLDLSRCYHLKALPNKTSNLSKLRHLDLSHCNSLCCMPSEIQRLNSLITMPLFVVGDRDSRCAALAELRVLNELRGVLVIRNLENVKEIGEAKAANLKGKKLHHLGLSWSHRVDDCHAVVEWLEPNPELRFLGLTGYGAYGFPSWIPNLHCLVKLLISDCRCTKLPALGGLQLLKELQLKELINIRSIGHEFYGEGEGDVFPSLENLKLHGMPNLNHWSNHSSSSASLRGVFGRLKRLSIQGCPELQTLPSLPQVTELVVWRSHSKILPLLTRIGSLSSVVINDMDVKESFAEMSSTSNSSVEKLNVVHSMDLDVLESSHINKFASLKYLRILHCLKLEEVRFPRLGSLEKLNVVDCQRLEKIDLRTEEFTLTELIIEDCPKLRKIEITTNYLGYGSSLRKLIVRNCPLFSISAQKIRELRGLEFVFLVGCDVREEEPSGAVQ